MEPDQRYQITLLRHALSIANEARIVQGQQDSALSEKGLAQAQALATYWQNNGKSFDRIISSPLERAAMTTKILSEKIPGEVEFNELWMERKYGTAEGMAYGDYRELLHSKPLPSPYENIFETGESEWALFLRASAAIQALLSHPPGKYLVVSHGGILNATLHSLLGVSPSSPNLRTRFAFENTGHASIQYNRVTHVWWLMYLNDRRHLSEFDGEDPAGKTKASKGD